MNVLYHLTILPPVRPACEAISQDISALRSRFDGDVIYLNPNRALPFSVPRLAFGFHRLRQLRTLEVDVHIHHVYNPDPFPFPILRILHKPVVYSLTGGVKGKRINKRFFGSMAAVTVMDEASLEYLKRCGLENVFLVRSGIDTNRFSSNPLPLRSEIRLMVGSAPWVLSQFKSKGIDALLQAAQRFPRLHLVFLWRGVLTERMERRVQRMGLKNRVKVLDEVVDVNQVLAGVHASVALAAKPDIVKAYPHSLLESLAAGKPVLVSKAIPMARYVAGEGCGLVIERVSPDHVVAALEVLEEKYADLQAAARHARKRDFSRRQMIDSYEEVYEQISRTD